MGNEVVARLLADERNGAVLGDIVDDTIKAGGFGIIERSVLVELPKDLFNAFVGRSANGLN